MTASGRWFRLNTTWSQSEWLAELTPAARLAWVELLGYVKAHGYAGRARTVSPAVLGRMIAIEPDDIRAMLAAAAADDALQVDDGEWVVTGWRDHQGDATAAERVRKYREKTPPDGVTDVTRNARNVTDVTPTETERKTDNKPSSHLSTRVEPLTMDDDARVSLVIRLANRGMSENPLIDRERFRPILPQHGESRQTVIDWRRAGVPWETIETTVYDRAAKYKPSSRYLQIKSMTYFADAVADEHERAQAMAIDAPAAIEAGETDHALLRPLAGTPHLLEWAERLDARLRADEVGMREAEKIRENLRRLNADDLKRMRAADAESFLWVRVLNWYGERVSDPRPADTKMSAA